MKRRKITETKKKKNNRNEIRNIEPKERRVKKSKNIPD